MSAAEGRYDEDDHPLQPVFDMAAKALTARSATTTRAVRQSATHEP